MQTDKKSIVCPHCFNVCESAVVWQIDTRTIKPEGDDARSYIASCDGCGKQFEVVQILVGGKWKIMAYRDIFNSPKYSKWINMTCSGFAFIHRDDFSSEPLVVTGPGGDFTKKHCGCDMASGKDRSVSVTVVNPVVIKEFAAAMKMMEANMKQMKAVLESLTV